MNSPEYDLVLEGGRIANADGTFVGTLGIRGGVIADVWHASATPDRLAARERQDCTGKWILPGGVDPHVHVGISFGGVQTPEDHASCTRAALLGGTTTIVDFAIGRPGQTPLDAVEERLAGARAGALTDYALHGCFTDRDAAHLDQIPEMVERGVRTIKVYTTYRDEMMASDELIRSVMERLLPYQGMTYVHAEDNSTIETLMAELARGGPVPFERIREARPEAAEEIAVRQVLRIAEDVGAPVYFVHQSTPTAAELTRAARARGLPAYSEVCPHYALLDESLYDGRIGEYFTCCPPLRSSSTVAALMRAVAAGHVDTLASDHCAFDSTVKTERRHDLSRMPFGMPGVQTRMAVMLSELYVHRKVPMSRIVALLSTNPARMSGLHPRKGSIHVGGDADLVLWSEEGQTAVSADRLEHDSDYTPFEGWQVHGQIVAVIRSGMVVCRDGVVVQEVAGQVLDSAPIEHALGTPHPRKELVS